ncbi:MAG TPA: NAD(P)H:quinone oxidoreductase type IV [Gillisia sp.]|nr:NAD(P)H:quinone oxidoreductase type IV [Gillisia sp.]
MMKNVKLAVIFYSSTGTNFQLAKWAAEAGEEAGAEEVKLLKIEETAPQEAINENKDWKDNMEAMRDVQTASLNDLEWADAIIFSVPTRYGNLPSQFAAFIDSTGGLWSQGKLADKVVSGMTSAQNIHGGQETTLMSLYKTMIHWGAIIAPPSYTDPVLFAAGGNPYGTSVTAGKDGLNDNARKAVAHQAERTLTVAGWVKSGKTR